MRDEPIAILTKYFPELTQHQQEQFAQLNTLYHSWNEKINVISRKDIDNLYVHHVLHSLSIAKFIKFKKETNVLDVGTGGGFPGIPLAIYFQEVNFFLADSIAKKIKVVEAVASEVRLTNIIARQIRVEEIKQRFDFIMSRAVADFPEIYNWTKRLILPESFNDKPNGWILLKGGDVETEMKSHYYEKTSLENYFEEDFFESKYLIYSPLKKP
jgi:16S rRNA (guanine527-N7)-methyltransferase